MKTKKKVTSTKRKRTLNLNTCAILAFPLFLLLLLFLGYFDLANFDKFLAETVLKVKDFDIDFYKITTIIASTFIPIAAVIITFVLQKRKTSELKLTMISKFVSYLYTISQTVEEIYIFSDKKTDQKRLDELFDKAYEVFKESETQYSQVCILFANNEKMEKMVREYYEWYRKAILLWYEYYKKGNQKKKKAVEAKRKSTLTESRDFIQPIKEEAKNLIADGF
jgi:hypothetical protein